MDRISGRLMIEIIYNMIFSAICDDIVVHHLYGTVYGSALCGFRWRFYAVSELIIFTFDSARRLMTKITCVKVSLTFVALRRGESSWQFYFYSSVEKQNIYFENVTVIFGN